jgi:hypothetical protein
MHLQPEAISQRAKLEDLGRYMDYVDEALPVDRLTIHILPAG